MGAAFVPAADVVGCGGGPRRERGVAIKRAQVPSNGALGTVCLATGVPSREGLIQTLSFP